MAEHLRAVALTLALSGPPLACLGRSHVPLDKPTSQATTRAAEVTRTSRTHDGILIETTRGNLQLSASRPDTFRLRFSRAGASRSLPSFAVDDAQAGGSAAKIEESDTLVMLRTEQALLRVDKRPLALRLMDGDGQLIADDLARPDLGADEVKLDFTLAPGERVFGLGDKVKGFDRRGQSFELWNTDAFGWKVDTDPLYKSLPVLLMLNQGRAYGLFIDYPARARVDVGATQADVLSYRAQGGADVDVYLFAGREPKRVLEAYTALTGRTPLPPLWALGHHQSRYGYLSEQEVRGVVTRMQQDRIPLDAVWLDIDFQQDNAPFTVNARAFPTFSKMIGDFRQAGVRTVAITDLHVKSYQGKPAAGYAPYQSGAQGDHFIRGQQGFFEGPVWPGPSVFPEFTRAASRDWWGTLYRGFVEQGVAGFWNDMNEPAVFVKDKTFPENLQHRLDDGSRASHALVHNAYGMLNARATYEGVRKLRPQERPFILTRAAYAGVQKYAASWTGDNTADRSHLAVTIPQLLNLGVSGYPFNGADVGGFVGCPDAELFAEWMELGALQPFFRNHSAKDACRREPWLFGPAIEARAKRAVEQRYRLLPYLYTLFEEAARTGLPVMRPLWLEYPNDPATYDNAVSYLLGRDLLVAPKLEAKATHVSVYLPDGDWYDIETQALLHGGRHQLPLTSGSSIKLLVRAGAIVPEQPLLQSTAQAPNGALSLDVWPGGDCVGSLYVDDGASFAFEQGAFRRIAYACDRSSSALSVTAQSSGNYRPWWRETRLAVHGVERAPTTVKDETGANLAYKLDAALKTLVVTLPDARSDFRVVASW